METFSHERYALSGEVRASALGIHFWSALDRETDTRVMVKALRRSEQGERALASFETEGRVTALLRHPGIQRLLDRGEAGDWAFHVYELADGRTLREVIDAGPVPRDQALSYARQIAEALAHVHAEGKTHGFCHPSNIVVSRSHQTKISGFAFGWEWSSAFVFGYSPREHAVDQVRTPATDVFVLGCVMWELFTGRPFLEVETPAQYVARLVKLPDADPGPSLPRWLRRLIARCLSSDPLLRPASADEVCVELEGRTPDVGISIVRDAMAEVSARAFCVPISSVLADVVRLGSPALAFYRLVDLWEVLIKLSTTAALGKAGASDAELGARPSLGLWCSALRKHQSTSSLARATLHLFDDFVAVRNQHKGHGALGDDATFLELLREHAPTTAHIVASSELFARLSWDAGELHRDGAPVGGQRLARSAKCETCDRTEVFFFNSVHGVSRSLLSYETGHVLREPAVRGGPLL